jgi:aminoglycoside 6'-N-acetyltransferase I
LTRVTFPEVRIRRVAAADREAWLRMRFALWPAERGEYGHERDVDAFLASQSGTLDVVLVADAHGVGPVGFLELRVREDTESSTGHSLPRVVGWYVEAEYRRRRIGARLLAAAQRWARAAGYSEPAAPARLSSSRDTSRTRSAKNH